MAIEHKMKHEMMEIQMMEMVEALTLQQLNKIGHDQVVLKLQLTFEYTEITLMDGI